MKVNMKVRDYLEFQKIYISVTNSSGLMFSYFLGVVRNKSGSFKVRTCKRNTIFSALCQNYEKECSHQVFK